MTIRAPLPGQGPTLGRSFWEVEQELSKKWTKEMKKRVQLKATSEGRVRNLRKQVRKIVRERKNWEWVQKPID